ncbi:MAG: hypothetical protein RJQ07_11195 [Pseudomonadales bacterium]
MLKPPGRPLLPLLLVALLSACTPSEPDDGFTSLPVGAEPPSSAPLSQLLTTVKMPGITTHMIFADDLPAVLIVSVDPNLYRPLLSAAPANGLTARAAIKQKQLSLVLGSGFTEHASSLQPVGLLKVGGQELSPLAPLGYTRILGINEEGLSVVHRASYNPDLFHEALQLGPGIIEDYQLDISAKDLERPRYYRSFAALCDTHWLVGVTLQPSHLRTLGTELLAFFNQQDLRCREVINFAGDRQALLAINTPDQLIYHGDLNSPKVSFLGFKQQ